MAGPWERCEKVSKQLDEGKGEGEEGQRKARKKGDAGEEGKRVGKAEGTGLRRRGRGRGWDSKKGRDCQRVIPKKKFM